MAASGLHHNFSVSIQSLVDAPELRYMAIRHQTETCNYKDLRIHHSVLHHFHLGELEVSLGVSKNRAD